MQCGNCFVRVSASASCFAYALALAACGESMGSPTDQGDASSSAGGATGTTAGGTGGNPDNGGNGSGPGGASSQDGASPIDGGSYSGEVDLIAFSFSDAGSFYAHFEDPVHEPARSCRITTSGPCTAYDCVSSAALAMAQRPHAGMITASFPDAGFNAIINPGANGDYSSLAPRTPKLAAGDMMDFKAAGADVPAFHETVANPDMLLVSEPAMPDSGVFSTTPGQNLKFTWTGGAPGVSLIVQSYSQITTGSMTCEVPSEVGALTIPAEWLNGLGGALLFVLTTRNHVFQAGPYAMKIRLATDAAVPDKSRGLSIRVR